jgi:HTH-type transcriptional regulator / antitoxin HipB
MKQKGLKTYSLEELTDKHIGKLGTPKREAFEHELRLDLLGEAIRRARLERKSTQEDLGRLVGVQKAQISKLENSLTDARFETILKVLRPSMQKSISMLSCLISTLNLLEVYLPETNRWYVLGRQFKVYQPKRTISQKVVRDNVI